MSGYRDIYEMPVPLPSAVPVLSGGYQSQMRRLKTAVNYNEQIEKRRQDRIKKELETRRLVEQKQREENRRRQEERRSQEEAKRREEEEEEKRYARLSATDSSKIECYNLFLDQEIWSNDIDEFRKKYKAKLLLLHPDKVDKDDPRYDIKINTFRLLSDCKKNVLGINFERYEDFRSAVARNMPSYRFHTDYTKVNILSYFDKEIYEILKDINEILKGYGVDTKAVLAGWSALSEYTDYADDSIELRVFTNETYNNRNVEVNKLRQYVANTLTVELNKYIDNNRHIVDHIKKDLGINLKKVNNKYFFQSYERFDIVDKKIVYSDQEFSESIPEDKYTLFLSAIKFSFTVGGSTPYISNLVDIVNYDDFTRNFTIKISQLEENLYALTLKDIKKDNEYILNYMRDKIAKLKDQLDEENKDVYDIKIKEKFGGYLDKSLRLNNTLSLSKMF